MASGSSTNNWEVGTFVFAKPTSEGHYLPGVVVDPQQCGKKNRKSKTKKAIFWFESQEVSMVETSRLKEFHKEVLFFYEHSASNQTLRQAIIKTLEDYYDEFDRAAFEILPEEEKKNVIRGLRRPPRRKFTVNKLPLCLSCREYKEGTNHPFFVGAICEPCKERLREEFLCIEKGNKKFCFLCGKDEARHTCMGKQNFLWKFCASCSLKYFPEQRCSKKGLKLRKEWLNNLENLYRIRGNLTWVEAITPNFTDTKVVFLYLNEQTKPTNKRGLNKLQELGFQKKNLSMLSVEDTATICNSGADLLIARPYPISKPWKKAISLIQFIARFQHIVNTMMKKQQVQWILDLPGSIPSSGRVAAFNALEQEPFVFCAPPKTCPLDTYRYVWTTLDIATEHVKKLHSYVYKI